MLNSDKDIAVRCVSNIDNFIQSDRSHSKQPW